MKWKSSITSSNPVRTSVNVSRSIHVSSSDSRELLVKEVFFPQVVLDPARTDRVCTSSFRLFFDMSFFTLLCILLIFSFSLASQETMPANEYYFIKNLIESKEIGKAKQELQKAILANPHDPTLNLYQAEIWIIEADTAYSNGNTSRALHLYEQAVKVYPANPLVQLRLKELKSARRVPISLVPNALIPQENPNLNSAETRITESGYRADNNKQLLYTILAIQIMILFFLAGLYRK